MKNLFTRLYLLLIIAFIGLGWGIDKLFDAYGEQSHQTTDLDLHKGTLFLLNGELQRKPSEQHEAWLAALAPSFGYPIQLLAAPSTEQLQTLTGKQITEQQQQYLQQGGVVPLFNDFMGESWFIRKLSGTNKLIVLGPILSGAPGRADVAYLLLFMAGLAIIVFAWAMPISRGLMKLTQAATQFGKGDFSVRAQTGVSAPLETLVARFNSMAERIQRLIKSHKELSHAISHELRTPIARIRFAMEMVREVDDPNMVDKYLNTMDENIEELDGLVDELLHYAKFEREDPQLHIIKQSLILLAEEVLERFRQTEPHLQFSLHVEENVRDLWFDKDAMTRTLDNLIRNAVRYASRDIRINLAHSNGMVYLSVNDDGPGVPEESRSSLFEPFVRLDKSRDRKSGGIGLGLAIVKRYIELHQGGVEIGQATLGGASFKLHWPSK